MGRRRWN
jgi:predicted ATPase